MPATTDTASALRAVAERALRDMGVDPAEELARAGAAAPWYAEPGDFEGPDGLLVCGKCGRPKETRFGDGVQPVLHRHQLGRLLAREEGGEERAARIRANRERCFSGEFRVEGERDLFSACAVDTCASAFDACMTFARTFRENRERRQGRGLILFGQVGRGKTFLAGCVCNALTDDGWRCRMTSTRAIRSIAEQRGYSYGEVLEALCRCDLVVLDDLFRDRDTEWGRELVFSTVDALYKLRVPTVVTTNLSRDSLFQPSAADRPVVDRLKERCERVEVTGPNRRQLHA